MKARIVIDMQGAQSNSSRKRGVGRYTREMVKELIFAYGDEADIFLALNGRLECNDLLKYYENILPRDNIKTWNYYPDVPPACDTDNGKIKPEELFREWFLHQFRADVIWSTNMQEGGAEPNIETSAKLTMGDEIIMTTLHDVVPLLFEKDYLAVPVVKAWYMKKIKYACDSDILLTVSNFSKQKIIEFLHVEQSKIEAISEGYDRKLFYPDPDYLASSKKEPFFLYVGGADPHKNLPRLIEAYLNLNSKITNEYKLYIVGKEPCEFKNSILKPFEEDNSKLHNIKWCGFIQDDELRILMQRCKAFIFPSYAEGFGLPPLEAMASGAPTIVAKAASLPEIVDNEEATFDPFSVDEISQKIQKIVTNYSFTNQLIKKGIERADYFSWSKAAEQLKQIIQAKVKLRRSGKRYSKNYLCNDLRDMLINSDYEELSKVAYSIEDSTIFSKIKKIYIDTSAVVLKDYVTGIQRVVNALIVNLQKIFLNDAVEVKAIYSSPELNDFYFSDFDGNRFIERAKNDAAGKAEFYDGDIFIMPDLHTRNVISKREMFEKLIARGIKVYTILYDIIPVQYPSFFPQGFAGEYEEYLKAIACFSGVISVSKTTMNYYQEWCGKNKIKFPPYFIQNFNHLGADINNANPSKGLPNDYNALLLEMKTSPTILMVSTIEPRKKQDQVLSAFDILWDQGKKVNLIFVGRNGWQMDTFIYTLNNHPQQGKQLFWLSGISDEYLDKIYENATGVIVASLEEGYGLSVIEGAKHNKPLLLRDITVFREVAADYASYFKGDSAGDLADSIEEWLGLIEEGRNPVSGKIKYNTWQESANQLIKIIDQQGLLRDQKLIFAEEAEDNSNQL